jgi:capsular polysaccharide biosynthesis protein
VVVKEFSPYETFMHAYRYLWLVVLLTILGGLAGFLFHRLQPPVYEASAVIELNIDLTQSDFAQVHPLTELEQDQAISAAMAVIASQAVLERVVIAAQAQDIQLDEISLVLGKNVFLERKHANQILRVRHTRPESAAQIANLWSDQAYQALVEAHTHATRARFLKEYLTALENCPSPQETSLDGPGFCQLQTYEELQTHIQTITEELHQELLSGKGIIPAIRFDQMQSAAIPTAPSSYQSNTLVFSGAAVGFIASTLAISLYPKKLCAGSKRRETEQ